MPLTALSDSGVVSAMLLSDDEWARLRDAGAELSAKCCGRRMHTRVSRRGLRHFVHHRRGDCTSAKETWQHLTAKDLVARAAAEAGWDVEVEAAGPGWVADVLAERGDRRFAFEIQWSSQSVEDADHRTDRYLADGIVPVWLRRWSRKRTDERPEQQGLARTFGLAVPDDGPVEVLVGHVWRPLGDVVADVLGGRLAWRRAFPLQQPGVVLVREQAWHCQSCDRPGTMLLWHADACCADGRPGAAYGPEADSPAMRRLIAQAQARRVLPGPAEGAFAPAEFRTRRGRQVTGWRCASCRWVSVVPWCLCCAGLDPVDPVAAVWAVPCRPETISRLLGGRPIAGPHHWCSTRVDPRTLAP